MKHIKYLLLTFLTYFSCLQVSLGQQPNILLIIADDFGIDAMEGFELDVNNPPNTPTLNELQNQGLSYMNTWSNPLCTPTRASIMSGKFGAKTGVTALASNLDLEHTSIFSYLKTTTHSSYASAVIGKWHISNPTNLNHPQEHGIDHYEGVIGGAVGDYYSWNKVTNGITSNVEEYITSHLTDAAIDWVDNQSQPWLLWLAHVAPHSPFQLPPDGLYTTNNPTSNRQLYNATIEAMDHEIGRLLDSMDAETRANTIIMFIGDNGTPASVSTYYPRGHTKGSLYEGGIRVPMIITGKNVNRIGEKEHGLTQVSDLYATIIELTSNQLEGGIHNSYSLLPSFSAANSIDRPYVYIDGKDDSSTSWAIKNDQYKLINNEDGNQEFYRVDENLLEQDNLLGNLSNEEVEVLSELSTEAEVIRTSWSCQDKILNGNEVTIDDCSGTSNCDQVDVLSFENIGCCDTPEYPSVYTEYFENNQRHIYSNGYPNHDFCYNPNNIPDQVYHYYRIDQQPVISGEISSIIRTNGRPLRQFGVALNGVLLSPAPGTPFIFVNQNTGEFNWDWVFEPTNNQGAGRDYVSLDCATAHTNDNGYHYHGEMFEHLETVQPGITSATSLPELFQVGWASDGFPIIYKFGPDAEGNIKELLPSYKLKDGERPGDGITAPCGPYTGKYTVDYEYVAGLGDLDECNGMAVPITLETPSGTESFDYFYVVTSTFPQISRCLVGNVSTDFQSGNGNITGIDNDGDGYLEEFECDDNNANINPSAVEIPNNGIDEDCDGADLITSAHDLANATINIYPNPTSEVLYIDVTGNLTYSVILYDSSGKKLISLINKAFINLSSLTAGNYILEIKDLKTGEKALEKIIKN